MASAQDFKIRFTAVGVTDVGQVREHNEDNFLAVDLASERRGKCGEVLSDGLQQRGISLVVADGMGGAAAGEVASQMAVDILNEEFRNADLGGTVRSEPDVIGLLETAINKANDAIFRKGQENKDQQGMGTTLTASVVLGDSLYLSQVGDSRGYILRKGKLVQMTRDQSLIGQLIEEGTLTEEQAEKLGGKNIILQALGVEETLKIDSKRYEILRGDVLLLCSDGLSGMVPDKEIERILNEEPDLRKAGKMLIDAANAGGGKDNITVILGRFEGEGLREPLTPLSDTDRAGGTFRAPPPPRSKAGRNAIVGTVAALAVIGAYIFWPKPKVVTFRVTNLADQAIPATLSITGAAEGGDPNFKREEEVPEGGTVDVELPQDRKFDLVVSSPGYSDRTDTIDTAVEHMKWMKEYVLALVPARSLKVLPPEHEGKPLSGVRARLYPPYPRMKEVELEVTAKPQPDFPDEFPAGRWKVVAERKGFERKEGQEFEVKSGEAVTVRLDPMKELEGSLRVVAAPEGAEIRIFDGEETLIPEPVVVHATRSATVPGVRATRVTVRVTRKEFDIPDQPVDVEAGKETVLDLSGQKASVSCVFPSEWSGVLRLTPKGGSGQSQSWPLRDGALKPRPIEAGTYEVRIQVPGVPAKSFPLVLEPGQQALDLDLEKLGQ